LHKLAPILFDPKMMNQATLLQLLLLLFLLLPPVATRKAMQKQEPEMPPSLLQLLLNAHNKHRRGVAGAVAS
jgi:hypothetical protein